MRTVIAGTLVTALPLLVAVGLVAAPKPKAAAPVRILMTGQGVTADGRKVTISAPATVTFDDAVPTPTPTPDPVSILSLTVKPTTVQAGQASTGTITLNRAPLMAVQVAIKSLDRGLTVAESVTINPGQASGTFAIGTPAAQSVPYWFSLSATYNGQSKAASLLVQPAGTPTPTPTPEPPLPVEPASPMVDRVSSDGMTLTVKGIGLGTAPGSLWWNGYPVPVTRWSDTEAVGPILWPSGAAPDWWGVQTAAGGLNASMAAPEQGEPVLPVPDSRRR